MRGRVWSITAVCLGVVILTAGGCATVAQRPHDFYIDLVKDASGGRFAFVVDGARLRDLEALKHFVAHLRRGSSLRWVQLCTWVEGQPLTTQAEIDDIRRHCEKHGVTFEIVGGG
jgi:hypothetical protein